MSGRGTNLGLLALLVATVVTGALAFAIGTGWAGWPVVAHGVAGLAILLLAPWKAPFVRRGLRRRRRGVWASVSLLALIAMALASGVTHAAGVRMGPPSAMQIHVAAGLASLPLAVWHLRARPVAARTVNPDRRALLRAGALLGGAGLAFATLGAVARLAAWPGADRRFTGSHRRGNGQAIPVTQWLNDRVPHVDGEAWALLVRTSVGEQRWPRAQLAALAEEVTATLDCTGGWYATLAWTGVPLDRLLPDATGRSILVRSATGYTRRFPLADAGRLWVATGADGSPLSGGHGFPARIVAPGRRGFWWVKWVTEIIVEDRPWWWQSPFPLT